MDKEDVVCVYIYIYTYIHTYTYICVCIYTHIHIHNRILFSHKEKTETVPFVTTRMELESIMLGEI